jgi:hypothetical protein
MSLHPCSFISAKISNFTNVVINVDLNLNFNTYESNHLVVFTDFLTIRIYLEF